jgi:alpha-amylase
MLPSIQVGDSLLERGHAALMTIDCASEVLDAILDYPSYFQLRSTFLDTQETFSSVASVLIHAQQKYKNGLFRTGSFVENHDQPRLASLTKDSAVGCFHYSTSFCPDRSRLQLIRNAMTFPFVHDGIPIVYYGRPPLSYFEGCP